SSSGCAQRFLDLRRSNSGLSLLITEGWIPDQQSNGIGKFGLRRKLVCKWTQFSLPCGLACEADEIRIRPIRSLSFPPLRVTCQKLELGSTYEAKECVVSVGGKHSIFNVMSVLIQQGDEVIIPSPYWVSFPDIVKYAGGTPVLVETRPEEGFSVRDAAIEKAITPRTKLLIVNSPCNPTGGVVPPDEY